MLVKSKNAAFINGRLLNVLSSGFTEPFEYKPKEGRKMPSHLVSVETVKAEPEEVKGKTKADIVQVLTEMGIKFNMADRKDVLESLLDAEIAKLVPGHIKPLDKTFI